MTLRAPFPWFGGKSRVAHIVWDRFGDVPNYVEPFAGSLAVLLGRPHAPRVETVNDRDAYISNFWRSLKSDPEAVAEWADWPVSEPDLHARHRWLTERRDFRDRMFTDPDYFDAKIAGWWVWGISQWIGSGWCSRPDWTGRVSHGAPRGILTDRYAQRPMLTPGQGVHQKRPRIARGGRGVGRQLPNLSGDGGAAGRGIHASAMPRKRPQLGGHNNKGVCSKDLHGKMPKADRGTASQLIIRREALLTWFDELAARLRKVRVCCGDWTRILGPSPTYLIGTTGVFLDPPYDPRAIATGANKVDGQAPSDSLYAHHDANISARVRDWALANGDNPQLRIALCGYEGEHEMPDSWAKVEWKAQGGYSVKADAQGKRNAERERIWFSPHCLGRSVRGPLFAEAPHA